MNWKRIVSACVFLGTLTLFANTGVPQYVQSNLAADPTGPPAVNIDPDLINAWGLTSCRLDRLEDDAKSLESFIGRFTDLNTNLPGNPGMTVYNAQNVNGKLYVTFATFTFLGGGVVDIFDTDGNLLTPEHLTANPGSSGPLQAPWGVALAPEDFGQFSSAILIGNVDDGHINAFDRHTHQFLGQLTDVNGNLLIGTDNLWGLLFDRGDRDANKLFFAAGPNGYADGLFGVISPVNGEDDVNGAALKKADPALLASPVQKLPRGRPHSPK